MNSYRLSRDAERDLIGIARYVAEKASLEVAENLLTEIIESIILIASHPGIGRPEEEYGRGFLSFPSNKYKIYYRKRKGGIVVLHVFHAARDQRRAWEKP
jgi:plasmid stabilization system protein ParE